MSDIQPRPPAPRGRSSGRGGRGGYHSRAGRNGTRHLNGDAKEAALVESLEEQGEIGELKKKYSSQLSMLKEVYPDWTDMDLVMALEECEGDIQITVDKITSGKEICQHTSDEISTDGAMSDRKRLAVLGREKEDERQISI